MTISATIYDETWITEEIRQFVATSPENCLGENTSEPAFDPPLVGFSNGSDPLYDEYVSHIGNFYLTPLKIFHLAFPEQPDVTAPDIAVISWILPSTRATRKDHSAQTRYPSERWARTRYYGEKFNEALRRHVVSRLMDAGISAVAPILAPFWEKSMEGPYAPCSNWSERHAAHAAGLGTFGLCDGLITPLGKAIRTGSVVARMAISPGPRPYTHHHAWCLHYTHGTCGKCISRCPVGAIRSAGHDKKRCMIYTDQTMRDHVKKTFGITTYACGLCQADVPCMDHIPGPEEG